MLHLHNVDLEQKNATLEVPGARDYLRNLYESRLRRNSAYSIRAFARDSKISPSMLSEFLSGKKRLSINQAEKIAANLILSDSETNHFIDLIELDVCKTDEQRARIERRVRERLQNQGQEAHLNVDGFKVISDWYHLAILALAGMETKKWNEQSCAEVLGIHTFQAKAAIERLIRLGLLDSTDDNLRIKKDAVYSPDGVPSEHIRKFHDQLLAKAAFALHHKPIEERDFYTYILAISDDDYPELTLEIREFYKTLFQKYSSRPNKNRVIGLMNQVLYLSSKVDA